ncbi:MAG: hypothetical protein LBK00_11030 [Treponema sp.]|jgi:hypothetical protein|nr:hypothetical protein [Treponema sp.]
MKVALYKPETDEVDVNVVAYANEAWLNLRGCIENPSECGGKRGPNEPKKPFNVFFCKKGSECWNFFRTSIIGTAPSGHEWIASHYAVFMHWGGHIHFGDGLDRYATPYYDILEQRSFPLEQYGVQDLASHIERWIDAGAYVMLDADTGKLIENPEFRIHELLMYGYDEERRIFYSPLQNGRTGKFEEFELRYDTVLAAVESVIAYYREYPLERVKRACQYFYPLTTIKIRAAHYDDTLFILMALKKLEAEYTGYRREFVRYEQTREAGECFVNYTGLGCLIGMRDVLAGLISTPDVGLSFSIGTSLFKLYEHRGILVSTLELLRDKLGISDTAYDSGLETYKARSGIMREAYLLMKKAEISNKKNSLPGIIQRLDAVYESDYTSLRDMASIARQALAGRL